MFSCGFCYQLHADAVQISVFGPHSLMSSKSKYTTIYWTFIWPTGNSKSIGSSWINRLPTFSRPALPLGALTQEVAPVFTHAFILERRNFLWASPSLSSTISIPLSPMNSDSWKTLSLCFSLSPLNSSGSNYYLIFLKCKYDYVPPLLQIFQWHPISLKIKPKPPNMVPLLSTPCFLHLPSPAAAEFSAPGLTLTHHSISHHGP